MVMVVDDGANPPTASEPDDASMPDPADQPDAPDELALARELVLKAHPQTVRELVVGGSLAELLASVPAAEAAFTRVVAAAHAAAERGTAAPAATAPGGGAVRSVGVNVEGLGPLAKIRAGISQS